MRKLGGKLKWKWQWRWFRLINNHLYYYKTPREAENNLPLGEIHLKDAEINEFVPTHKIVETQARTSSEVLNQEKEIQENECQDNNSISLSQTESEDSLIIRKKKRKEKHVFYVRIPGKKIYYLRTNSDQELRMWKFNLLLVQRALKVILSFHFISFHFYLFFYLFVCDLFFPSFLPFLQISFFISK